MFEIFEVQIKKLNSNNSSAKKGSTNPGLSFKLAGKLESLPLMATPLFQVQDTLATLCCCPALAKAIQLFAKIF